ncbi:MAG: carbamate kinase [Thermoplasmata archaeon]|nr:MAG: carbamate kinase [Thermoplasmata archaeon]
MKTTVIALGGNALIKPGQKGTIYEQFANTREVVKSIARIIREEIKVVLTHGNGPQVGAILLQNNLARKLIPPMPLGICVAESEGFIGYMIQQCLSNALNSIGIRKQVATIVTQVLVDKNDSAFNNPTKPIGPYYTQREAKVLMKDGYSMREFPRGWRIVVPSPDPKSIVEGEVIRKMIENDIIVIAAGGGGLPVVEKENWGLDGVEAVVDKDLASERLAEAIKADTMIILTNVENVYLNYNKPNQKALREVSLDEIKNFYEKGYFPAGSMGPKILASIRFLENGGKKVVISHVNYAWEAFKEEKGTIIER